MCIEGINSKVRVLDYDSIAVSVHPLSSYYLTADSRIDIAAAVGFYIDTVVVSRNVVHISRSVKVCGYIPELGLWRPYRICSSVSRESERIYHH